MNNQPNLVSNQKAESVFDPRTLLSNLGPTKLLAAAYDQAFNELEKSSEIQDQK